jgi:hypothetical protein
VHGSRMGAASATISPLGLELDLMEHKVLMRMRGGARCKSDGASALMAGVGDWMEARAREAVARLRGATVTRATTTGGRRGRMGVNPNPSHSIYRGSSGSARCGSFHRTTCYNGSILVISRDDCAGFIVNRLSHDLNSEFGSSAANKTLSGHPDDKQRLTRLHITLI